MPQRASRDYLESSVATCSGDQTHDRRPLRSEPMPTWTLLILAVGLSADACAVAMGRGLLLRDGIATTALVLGGAFGLAQGVMPVIGWLLGQTFADHVSSVAPWIAFVLLTGVGVKMIHDALGSSDHHDGTRASTGSSGATTAARSGRPARSEILILAIATSLDALAVGVSLAMLDVSIWWTSLTIGVVTATLCSAAVFIGHKVGSRFRGPAEVGGGLILLVIAVRVLII